MKKLTKILCVLLVLVMTLSSVSVAFAKEPVTPIIVMHGLGGSDIYNDYGTEDASKIPQYGLDTSAMLQDQTLIQEALKLLDKGRKVNYNKLFGELGKILGATGFNCTANGNPQPGQDIDSKWTDSLKNHPEYLTLRNFSINAVTRSLCDIVNPKNVYAFNYDWRLDACYNAKLLRKFVVNVKKQTGAKKVEIVGFSLGGAVVSAYMDAYKSKGDVAKYVMLCGAQEGVDVARLFRMDFVLDKKSVLTYLKHLEGAFEGGAQMKIFRAVNAFGDARIGTAVDKLNKEVAQNPARKKQFYLTVMKPWLANCPAPWECIPYKEFDACVKQMSKLGILDKKSGLYKKIANYHKVQGRFESNVKYLKKHGAEVVVIANYGVRGLPLTSKKNNQTDMVIDTKYASCGATVAQYGKKLKRSGKYVSRDKVVDASTCVVPDSTWLIKNMSHGMIRYNTPATKMIARLIAYKGKTNIKTIKKKYGYSQFMKADENQNIKKV